MKKLLLILLCLPMIGLGQQSLIFRPIPSFSEFQTAKMVGQKNLEFTFLTSLIFQPKKSSTLSYPHSSTSGLQFQQNDAIMPTFGFISIYGLRKKLDIRVRVNFLKPSEKIRGYLVHWSNKQDSPIPFEFSCGTKFSLITNRLALNTDFNMQQQNAEVSFLEKSMCRRVDFIPTLLYTYSFDNKNSITFSLKHFQPLYQSSIYSDLGYDFDDKVLSFGSISCNAVFNIKDWRLVPEISLLHAYGQNDIHDFAHFLPSSDEDGLIPIYSEELFITPFYFQIGIGVTKTFSEISF